MTPADHPLLCMGLFSRFWWVLPGQSSPGMSSLFMSPLSPHIGAIESGFGTSMRGGGTSG